MPHGENPTSHAHLAWPRPLTWPDRDQSCGAAELGKCIARACASNRDGQQHWLHLATWQLFPNSRSPNTLVYMIATNHSLVAMSIINGRVHYVPILLEASLEIYSANQFQDSYPRKFSASKIKRYTVYMFRSSRFIRGLSPYTQETPLK